MLNFPKYANLNHLLSLNPHNFHKHPIFIFVQKIKTECFHNFAKNFSNKK